MKIIVTANKLNKRKTIPFTFPDKAGIVGVVLKGFQFEGEEAITPPNVSSGKWYVDRDGYFYWGGGLLITSDQAAGTAPILRNSTIPLPTNLPSGCILGADVSHHNSTPDWEAMVAENIQFVYIKISEGVGTRDRMAQSHSNNAMRSGLRIGYYHFCRPDARTNGSVIDDARAEAKEALDVLKNLPAAQLPLVLDLEDTVTWDTPLNKSDYLLWINTFIAEIGKASSIGCMIYSRAEYLNRKLPPNHDLGRIKLWISRYGLTSTARLECPRGWNDWTIWQFSEKGQVGNNKVLDLNIMKA